MTSDPTHLHEEMDDDLSEVARAPQRLLATMPPRFPQSVPDLGGCGWCGHPGDGEPTEPRVWAQREEDPAAWTLHVLREHLRPLLAEVECIVQFNAAGGAVVQVFGGVPEDVALFRDALGVDLIGALPLEGGHCVVCFGRNPYAREVTMAWYTTPRFLHTATELIGIVQRLFPPPPET